MLGPEAVAAALVDLLDEHLPAAAAAVVARVEAARLPRLQREAMAPSLIAPFDVLDLPLDAFPAFLVVVQRLAGLRRLEVGQAADDAGLARYAATYPVRIFVWVRGQDDTAADELLDGQAADLARKRLTLALRETLLGHQITEVTLGASTGIDEGDPGYAAGTAVIIRVDESTIAESYSDVGEDDISTVAASWLDVTVTVEETLELAAALPTADEVAVAVAAL